MVGLRTKNLCGVLLLVAPFLEEILFTRDYGRTLDDGIFSVLTVIPNPVAIC